MTVEDAFTQAGKEAHKVIDGAKQTIENTPENLAKLSARVADEAGKVADEVRETVDDFIRDPGQSVEDAFTQAGKEAHSGLLPVRC